MIRFTATILSLTLLGLTSAGAASSGLIVTFNNIPGRIQRDNPDLAAARFRIKEATGHMHQAGRRSNPELEGGWEHNTDFREGKIEIGISQKFPVTNRLQIEKDVSVSELKAAEAEVEEVARGIVAEARTHLVEVLALREQRKLRSQQAEVAKKLADFTRESAKRGELSSIDAGQANLEAARLSSEIRLLKASEVAAIGKLKPLLGMRISDTLHVSGTLPAASLPSRRIDPNDRPDYQAAKHDANAASRSVDLERSRRYEDIEAGLVAGLERTEDAPDGYDNEGIIGFRVKVALPFWDKNEGNIEAAEAKAERKQKEITALAHNIHHEADGTYKEMLEWLKMLNEVSNNLLPLAAEQAANADQAYRDQLGNLQSVLRAREQQLELSASRIEALKNFHLARVRFDAAAAN